MERDSIIVSVSELRSLIQDIRRSGSHYVKISISEEDVIDGEPYPAELDLRMGYFPFYNLQYNSTFSFSFFSSF